MISCFASGQSLRKVEGSGIPAQKRLSTQTSRTSFLCDPQQKCKKTEQEIGGRFLQKDENATDFREIGAPASKIGSDFYTTRFFLFRIRFSTSHSQKSDRLVTYRFRFLKHDFGEFGLDFSQKYHTVFHSKNPVDAEGR